MATAPADIVVKVDAQIADMVPRFLANRTRDVATLRQAIASRDREALRQAGHTLKGVGGGYGFAAISEIGERIENAALDAPVEAISRAVEELADFLDRVRIVFE